MSEAVAALSACPGCGAASSGQICACGLTLQAGRFRILRVISQTPHSRLYAAADMDGTLVALKELAYAFAPGAEQVEAFYREAKLLEQLSVPGIPRFVAAFEEGSGPALHLYLAQELIEGESLDKYLLHSRVIEDEAIAIADQVLATLELIHTNTPPVFHRDIKPANLIRRPDGSVALVDFGVARQSGAGGTHRATMVGTFGYAPADQLGGSVDATTDLYALGATLLHLVTRQPPEALLRDGLRLDIPPSISPGLRRVLQQLTEPRRQKRFRSAAEARGALLSREARSWPRRHWAVLVVVALLAVRIGVGLGLSHPRQLAHLRAVVSRAHDDTSGHDPALEWAQWHLPPDSPPSSEYVLDVSSATVLDTVTGLMWQREAQPDVSWDTADHQCRAKNLGGHNSGWRLPTIIELISLVSTTAPGTTINEDAFPHAQPGSFWSATLNAPLAGAATDPTEERWYEDFGSGHANAGAVAGARWSRCVWTPPRDGLAQEDRFREEQGVVTDSVTGLLWQRDVPAARSFWTDAATACSRLSLGPYVDGWRLPTMKELFSLVDFQRTKAPAIDTVAFPGVSAEWFWTSSVVAQTPPSHHIIQFGDGRDGTSMPSDAGRVRCVRDPPQR